MMDLGVGFSVSDHLAVSPSTNADVEWVKMENRMNSIPFQYDPKIKIDFPNLSGFAIRGYRLSNSPADVGLAALYQEEQARVKQKIGTGALSEIPSLIGWRSAFRKFGVDPTQYRCAAEALLRRLQKKGDIPTINIVVDCCNLISIRYALPVAAIDLKQVIGKVTVKYSDGHEHFNPLGEDQPGPPDPGEVIFIDEVGLVLARRWCWRQSVESAAGLSTSEVLITIEAQDVACGDIIDQAGMELIHLLEKYVGGEYHSVRIA